MALDEPTENDTVFQLDGISYIIDKELFNQAKPIRVDFVTTGMESGFLIDSNISKATPTASSCRCR